MASLDANLKDLGYWVEEGGEYRIEIEHPGDEFKVTVVEVSASTSRRAKHKFKPGRGKTLRAALSRAIDNMFP